MSSAPKEAPNQQTTQQETMHQEPTQPEFAPRIAIVTGSDSGIGRATAVALAQAGMDVGVTWHSDRAGAEATAAEVRDQGQRAALAQLDTTDLDGCGDAIDTLIEDLGGCDVFVNNSGTGDNAPFLEMTLEDWRHTVAADLDGAFVCLQRAAQQMVRQGTGGRIIAVTSVHEHQPRVGSSAYDAAKHGLGGLVKTMALELCEHGITANAVAPGEIATPMTGQTHEDPRRTARPGIPLGRPGDAWEIADLVAFGASTQRAWSVRLCHRGLLGGRWRDAPDGSPGRLPNRERHQARGESSSGRSTPCQDESWLPTVGS